MEDEEQIPDGSSQKKNPEESFKSCVSNFEFADF